MLNILLNLLYHGKCFKDKKYFPPFLKFALYGGLNNVIFFSIFQAGNVFQEVFLVFQ